jgi:hypothetical protein
MSAEEISSSSKEKLAANEPIAELSSDGLVMSENEPPEYLNSLMKYAIRGLDP